MNAELTQYVAQKIIQYGDELTVCIYSETNEDANILKYYIGKRCKSYGHLGSSSVHAIGVLDKNQPVGFHNKYLIFITYFSVIDRHPLVFRAIRNMCVMKNSEIHIIQ